MKTILRLWIKYKAIYLLIMKKTIKIKLWKFTIGQKKYQKIKKYKSNQIKALKNHPMKKKQNKNVFVFKQVNLILQLKIISLLHYLIKHNYSCNH